jgi:hypothetical protein
MSVLHDPVMSWDLDARCRCHLMRPVRVLAWREANEMADPELMREALAGRRAVCPAASTCAVTIGPGLT